MTIKAHHFVSRDAAQAHYLAMIDAVAARARYVDPAQEAVYQIKLQESRSGGGPLLTAEAESIGAEVSDVALAVLRERDRWEQYAKEVEIARIKARQAVRESVNAAEMHRAVKELELSVLT